MTTTTTPYDHLNGFYRPGLSLIEQLLATTVGRDELLRLFTVKLKSRQEEEEKQNFLLMGPPGVGKTHFIRVLAETVHKTEELSKQYAIIQFPEENHRILTFADLLLGIVEILGNISPARNWNALYDKLIELEDDTELIDTAIPELERYCESSNRSLLILLENIDVFFKGQLRDSKNLKQFKKFIIKSPFATFIGTSQYNLIKSDELRKPPFNLFDIHILDVLEDNQTVELIKKNLEWEKQTELLAAFDDLLPRLKALFEMSGGNPRLSLILYELIAKENKWDIKRQIEKLLDQTSPFFRVRMRSLAPQERALLETIALVKLEQKTAGFIAKCLRQSLQQTTSHLNKLLKAGYLVVTDHPIDKRTKIYRIKEGFFGLWLAIGHAREQHTILPRLVEFLEQWYAEKSGRERKRQQIWNSIKIEDSVTNRIEINNQELLLKYLSDIGQKEEKLQSKFELIFYCLSIGKTKDAKQLMAEIYKIGFKKPFYMDWMLKQCRNWIMGKMEPVILQQMEDVVQCWKLKGLGETELLTNATLNLVHNFSANGYFELIQSFADDMLQAIHDPKSVALLLERVAIGHEKMKCWNAALKTWNMVLDAAKQSGDLKSQGTILNNISQIYQDLGEYDTALTYLKESLAILNKINDFDGQGTTLNNISTIYFERGYFEKALERLEQALSIAKTGRNLYIEGISLSNISLIYQARGDYERALDFLDRARLNMKRINNRPAECIALNNISQIYLEIGNLVESYENVQAAIQIAKEDLNKPALALSLYNRGKTLLKGNKEKEAIPDLMTAFQLAKEEGLNEILEKLDQLAQSLGAKGNETFWQDRQKDFFMQESHVGLP